MSVGRRGVLGGLVVVVAVASALVVTGCTSSGAGGGAESESELRQRYPRPIDLANARAECLTSKGWVVEVHPDASIESTFPSNRSDEYDRDELACQRRVGIDPDAATPKEIVLRDYRRYVDAAECLRSHGWSIADAPTRQAFVDRYEGDPWFPWDDVPAGDADEAERACPFPAPSY